MILLIHNHNEVIELLDRDANRQLTISSNNFVGCLKEIVNTQPTQILVWCLDGLQSSIDFDYIKSSFQPANKMISFAQNNPIPDQIGYVEQSPFIKINKEVCYPTWLMSDAIGAVHLNTLTRFLNYLDPGESIVFNLCSLAKLGMPNGLFCYSDPQLVLNSTIQEVIKSKVFSDSDLYKFVKQHFKSQWLLFLAGCYLIYERKPHIKPLFKAGILYRRKKYNGNQLVLKKYKLQEVEKSKVNTDFDVDVIIPTMDRKAYLLGVLQDLKSQTLLPRKVIIVEQNPDKNSVSDLDYLSKTAWPFEICHHFIRQTGACNARNIGLQECDGDFVFFADDDIRLDEDLIEKTLDQMALYGVKATTLSCLKPEEQETIECPVQWHTFGSGCSVIRRSSLLDIEFNLSFEHGFGEDADFGMQLRNKGVDISYFPNCNLTHLKAPTGGFRVSVIQPWSKEEVIPKPSPTVMLFNLKHRSHYQIQGYKTILFIKFFRVHPVLNIVSYVQNMRKRWERSIYWANVINHRLE